MILLLSDPEERKQPITVDVCSLAVKVYRCTTTGWI